MVQINYRIIGLAVFKTQKMKHIIIFLFLLKTSTLNAQDEFVFNKIYQLDTVSVSSLAAVISEQQIFVAGLTGNFGWSGTYLQKLDVSGQEMNFLIPDGGTYDRSMINGGSLLDCEEHIMLASSRSRFVGGDMDILLTKLGMNGEVLWTRAYGDTVQAQTAIDITQTSDNGYLIVGAEQYQLNPARFYVLKLNEAGDVEWENTYGLDGHSAAFSAVQTQDEGYLISGYGYHIIKGYELFFVRTDALGTELWTKHYGTMDDDGAAHLTPTNSGYIMRGSIKENNHYKQYIALTDYDVEILSANTIGRGEVFSLQTPLVPDGGNYVASGFCADIDGDPAMGVLAKFNSAGDTLWTRTFKTSSIPDDYFRDVDIAPDGGYVLTGFVLDSPQKSWVVKTDANGNTCSFVGCDSTIMAPDAVPIVERNPYQISVSPNPATDYGEVNYRFPMRSPCGYIRLFNLAGKEVLAERLHTHAQSQTLNLSGLPAGIYAYSVTFEGRRMFAGKLAVE